MRLSRPLAGLAAAALLGTGALSGCGLSDIQAAPGVAAEVRGTEISVEEVDQLSATTCEVLRSNPELLGQGYTGSPVRDTVLARLAQRSGRLETDGQTFAFPLRPESGHPGIVAGVFSDRLDPGALDLPRTVRRLTRQLEVSTVHLETALLFTAFRDAATADERRRLSREMHDGVAQEIASLGYLVDALAATPASDEQAARFLMLRERVSEVVAEVRRSVVTLRTTVGESESLGAAIGSLARNLSQLSGVVIEVTLDEKSQRLRGEVEAELFRITQEALNNAVKHAQCTLIRVHCHVDAPAATISVTDNGRGLGDIGLPLDARADSYGLGIMRERAALIGAHLDIEEPPGGGLRVAVAVSSGHPATPTGRASESPREIQVSR